MKIKDKIIGRLIVFADNLSRIVKNVLPEKESKIKNTRTDKFESTGIHILPGVKAELIENDKNILLVDYDNLSHKLWRAQEFTLINNNKERLSTPILDLGCGDGSFASVVFDKIDYGVDPDSFAIETAASLKVYDNFLNTLAEETGLPDNSIGSVFSNSVLEHTQQLELIIKEVHRILVPKGVFMITIPNNSFTEIITSYFGKKEADRLNETEFFHRNLWNNSKWSTVLEAAGFEIEKIQNYQPDRFNYVFRMLRSPLVKRINNLTKFWGNDTFLELISKSLDCNQGAGTFIIAKKKLN